MKKALMAASVPSMIGQFNMSNIQLLQDLDYEVHIACNFYDKSVWTTKRTEAFVTELKEKKVYYHQIDFPRNPLNMKRILLSCRQLKELARKESFDLIHCHTPVAGVIARLVAHKQKIKVIYTAHGFHFYKGAPMKNWLLYYPVEWLCSWWTDILITINREDYSRARKRLHAKKTVYVPGVGIDMDKFQEETVDVDKKRAELGLNDDDSMLLSVGELNRNKNHQIVIRAITKLNNRNIHYFIAGKGELEDELRKLAEQLGVNGQVHLLGYRTDVPELLKIADLYLLPSLREGLNVSLMEAMASGLPCICSNIRGNKDLIEIDVGVDCVSSSDENDWIKAIRKTISDDTSFETVNRNTIKNNFSVEIVSGKMRRIYKE